MKSKSKLGIFLVFIIFAIFGLYSLIFWNMNSSSSQLSLSSSLESNSYQNSNVSANNNNQIEKPSSSYRASSNFSHAPLSIDNVETDVSTINYLANEFENHANEIRENTAKRQLNDSVNSLQSIKTVNDFDVYWKVVDHVLYINNQSVSGDESYSGFNSEDLPGWYDVRYKIYKVIIEGDITPKCTSSWFGCMDKKDIGKKVKLSNITDFSNLDKIHFDNVEDASFMFTGVNLLSNPDSVILPNFTGNKITNAYAMCSLTNFSNDNLNTIAINLNKAIDLGFCFSKNNNLVSIDVSNIDFEHLTNLESMFMSDINLVSIDGLTGKTVKTANNINWLFYNDSKLVNIDVSSLVGESVQKMEGTFAGCNAEIINRENWNTNNLEDLSYFFRNVSNIDTEQLTNIVSNKIKIIKGMFENSCIASINVRDWDISNITDMRDLFKDCKDLTTIYGLNDTDWSSLQAVSDNMFLNCTNLEGGNGTGYDANNVNNLYAKIDGLSGSKGYFTVDSTIIPRVKASELNNGDKVIIACPDGFSSNDLSVPALGGNGTGTFIARENVVLSSDASSIIKTSENVAVLTVSKAPLTTNPSIFTYQFINSNGLLLKSKSAVEKTLLFTNDSSYNIDRWILNENNDGDTCTIAQSSGSSWKIQYNKQAPRFTTYSSTQKPNMSFYRVSEGDPSISFSCDNNGKIMNGESVYVDSGASRVESFKKGTSVNVENSNLTIDTLKLNAQPNDDNFEFDKWVDNNGQKISDGIYELDQVLSFKAMFKVVLKNFNVTVKNSNGKIINNANVVFKVDDISYEGVYNESLQKYVVSNVAKGTVGTIDVSAEGYNSQSVEYIVGLVDPEDIILEKEQWLTLTLQGDEGIDLFTTVDGEALESSVQVLSGNSFSFKVNAKDNYKVKEVKADDEIVVEDDIYTIIPTKEQTVTASSEKDLGFDVVIDGSNGFNLIKKSGVEYSISDELNWKSSFVSNASTGLSLYSGSPTRYFEMRSLSSDYKISSVNISCSYSAKSSSILRMTYGNGSTDYKEAKIYNTTTSVEFSDFGNCDFIKLINNNAKGAIKITSVTIHFDKVN